MIVVAGVGWITRDEYGCVLGNMRQPYDGMKSLRRRLQEASIFQYPVKNLGKFNAASKMTCCAVSLALRDAGASYSRTQKQAIGIFGTNKAGCLQSNVDYFKDYVENGSKLGRANLFVYTLPSSPLADVAVYFGFQGPLLYMTWGHLNVPGLLRDAEKTILRGDASAMLASVCDATQAICFFLRPEKDASTRRIFSLRNVIDVTAGAPPFDEMITDLSQMTSA